jgi:hypothetical protein
MSGQLQVKTYIKVLHHQSPSKESVLTSTMVMNRKWDVNQVAYRPTGYKLVFTQAPIQREICNGIPGSPKVWGSLPSKDYAPRFCGNMRSQKQAGQSLLSRVGPKTSLWESHLQFRECCINMQNLPRPLIKVTPAIPQINVVSSDFLPKIKQGKATQWHYLQAQNRCSIKRLQ